MSKATGNHLQTLEEAIVNIYGERTGGRAKRAGRKNNVTTSSHPSDIMSNLPMLAVPGCPDNHNAPKAVAVVRALKSTALMRLD